MIPSKMTDDDLLLTLYTWMRFDTGDLNKNIHEIKRDWPRNFWNVWREIKARKLDWKKPNEFYLGIVGTRARDNYEDYQLLYTTFKDVVFRAVDKPKPEEVVIVSGLCTKGADKFATILYKTFGTKKLWFPAEWDKYGKAKAGFIRNTDIAMVSDKLISMVRPDRKGGTEDTILKFCTIQQHTKNLTLL